VHRGSAGARSSENRSLSASRALGALPCPVGRTDHERESATEELGPSGEGRPRAARAVPTIAPWAVARAPSRGRRRSPARCGAGCGAPLGGGIGLGLVLGFAAAALARDAGYEASFGEWTAYGGGLGGVFALAALAAGV